MREYLPTAALVLLCMIVVPAAQADPGNNGGASTASAEGTGSNGGATVTGSATSTGGATVTANAQHTQQTNGQAAAAASNDPTKGKQKASTKPRDKSVLDAEVLESPIGYFKNAFSSEEESTDAAPSSNAVMLTVKALVATLLSTIM